MRGSTGAAGAKARGGISNNSSSSSRGVFNYTSNHDHNSSNASKTAAVSVNINDVAHSMHSDSSVTLVSGSLSKGRRRPRRELQRRTTVSSLDDSLHDGVTDSTTTKNCDWKDPNGNRGSRRRPQIDMSRMISICDSSAKNNEDTRATCSDSLASYSYTSSLGEDDLSSIGFVSVSRAPSGHVIGSSSSVVSPTPAAVSLNHFQNYKVLRDNMQLPSQSQHSFISSLDDNSSLASGFSSRGGGGGGGQTTRDRHTLVKRESRASLDDSLHNDCGKANVYSRPPTSAPASLSPPESLSKMKLSVSNESLHDDKELRSSPKNNKKFRKSRPVVKFGKVDIREFEIEIGDNPSCSRGPAVALGWKILKEESYHHVDRFERVRRNARYKTAPDMVLGRHEREKMLLENGFSTGDIAAAVRKIVRIKNQRRQTVNNLPVARFEEIVEVAGRKVKRLFSHKSKSNEVTSLFPTSPSTASINVERNAGVDKSMSYSGSEESGSIDIRSKLGVMTLRKKSPSLSPIVADEPEVLDDIFASNTSNHLSSTEALSVSFSTMT
eukprot:CAMPEP_0116052590 /NCGR_PEP_ID=MMETSP0322-20121206/1663_1 /TAXON_ID=163516 /ORGANISM="Leptocylindrus danicus var. apora, Strain B651" /LENGTH=551 /DNA_ID=CAMNT_0003535553 /DNA_START=398 /DNA_END=2053 /DNA_ORIENTATION=-